MTVGENRGNFEVAETIARYPVGKRVRTRLVTRNGLQCRLRSEDDEEFVLQQLPDTGERRLEGDQDACAAKSEGLSAGHIQAQPRNAVRFMSERTAPEIRPLGTELSADIDDGDGARPFGKRPRRRDRSPRG